jgi:hypothetical protein
MTLGFRSRKSPWLIEIALYEGSEETEGIICDRGAISKSRSRTVIINMTETVDQR